MPIEYAYRVRGAYPYQHHCYMNIVAKGKRRIQESKARQRQHANLLSQANRNAVDMSSPSVSPSFVGFDPDEKKGRIKAEVTSGINDAKCRRLDMLGNKQRKHGGGEEYMDKE